MTDFELGSDFLYISSGGADSLTMLSMAPDPKSIKKKSLLVIKARQESDAVDEEDAVNANFPTGIANEVVFMEITGKMLQNLYGTCSVSKISEKNCSRIPSLECFSSLPLCWPRIFWKFEFLSFHVISSMILAVGFARFILDLQLKPVSIIFLESCETLI